MDGIETEEKTGDAAARCYVRLVDEERESADLYF